MSRHGAALAAITALIAVQAASAQPRNGFWLYNGTGEDMVAAETATPASGGEPEQLLAAPLATRGAALIEPRRPDCRIAFRILLRSGQLVLVPPFDACRTDRIEVGPGQVDPALRRLGGPSTGTVAEPPVASGPLTADQLIEALRRRDPGFDGPTRGIRPVPTPQAIEPVEPWGLAPRGGPRR